MWLYEKKLQYPVKIKKPNAAFAKIIISQLGGPFSKRIYKKTDRPVRLFYSIEII